MVNNEKTSLIMQGGMQDLLFYAAMLPVSLLRWAEKRLERGYGTVLCM